MEKQEQNGTNPLIEQYWETEEHEKIESLLHKSLKTQDPSVLIRSIPFIQSLRKDSKAICFMHKSHHFNFSSSTVYMAA